MISGGYTQYKMVPSCKWKATDVSDMHLFWCLCWIYMRVFSQLPLFKHLDECNCACVPVEGRLERVRNPNRDFLSLVTSLAGSLILWRSKIVISFVCDKGWMYGIPKIFHQQWMGFVLTMNWSMLSAGQLRGGGSSPGPGTGGWVFILRKLLIMISHDST